MNIGITGTKNYQNINKIKKFIFNELKQKLVNEKYQIVTTGRTVGADLIVKNICFDFNIPYKEVISYESRWNQFCLDENRWKFGKPHANKHFPIWMNSFLKETDILFVFNEENSNDKIVEYLLSHKNKYNVVTI